jgi:hypothetical protein
MSVSLTGSWFLSRTLITEPPAGEHCFPPGVIVDF